MSRSLGLFVVILAVGCKGDDTGDTDGEGTGGVEGAPEAMDVDATVVEDTQTNIRLEATSPDDEDMTFAIDEAPSFGTLSLEGQRVEYTPDANYNGPDSFTFTATDPDGTSAPATVNITVTPVNDVPTANISDVWSMAGQQVVLEAEATDVDGDTVTLQWNQISGPTVDLTGDTPSFSVPWAGTYALELDLSDGTETVSVPVNIRVMDIDMSEEHVVAVDAQGVAWTWGANDGNEGGPVASENRVPVPVCTVGTSFPCTVFLHDVAAVAAGDDYSLALLDNGTVVGWGTDANSGLGEDKPAPGLIGNLADITAIATSGYHNLALDEDGTVWSWGGNRTGQLGHGTEGNDVSPDNAAQVCTAFDFDAVDAECTEFLSDVVAIEVAKDDELHSMALDSSGTVWAWGDSRNGVFADGCVERDDCDRRRIAMPVCTAESAATDTCVALGGGAAIAMGGEHAIALMTDGTAMTWGDDNDGVLAQGCDLSSDLCDEVSVPAAVCAPGESAPCTPMSDISAVSSGAEHTLLLTTDGSLYAVGGNSEGELGNGCEGELNCRDSVSTVEPVCALGEAFPCAPMTNIVGIRAGYENSFALTNTGELLAWGYNSSSMLGDGSEGIPFARQLGFDTDWDTVETAEHVAVALKTDGSLWAWGDNDDGAVGNCDVGPLGDDPDNCTITPYRPVHLSDGDLSTFATDWVDIFAGYAHLGAIKADGTAWLWGQSDDGALGQDIDIPLGVPTELTMSGWTALDAGDQITIGLSDDGTLWAWGDNGRGQLANTEVINSPTPLQVISDGQTTPDTDWVSVHVGDDYTLAIKADGTLWGWGENSDGQLASGTDDDIEFPTAVLGPEGSPSPTDWDTVSAGQDHVVGIRSGALWAWGDGDDGRLGNGCLVTDTCDNWDETTTPVPVGGPGGDAATSDWSAVSAGRDHTLALRNDGQVFAFGENRNGALGTGLQSDTSVLTPVCAEWNALTWTCAVPLTNVTHVTAGEATGFAVRDDGTLWAWGNNEDGQLGLGRPDAGYPVQVLWQTAGR